MKQKGAFLMANNMKNRIIALLLTIVAVLCCACSSEETAAPVEPVTDEETVEDTKHEEITILFTGNLMGEAKTEADLKAVSERAEELKKSDILVDIVDCGNHVSADGSVSLETALGTLKAMRSAGYSHVVLNGHEFDFGIDGIRQMLAAEGPRNMSCNFRYSGFSDDITKEVARFDVTEIGSVRIGYVAVTDIAVQNSHSDFFIEDGRIAYSFCGRSSSFLADTIQNSINACKSEGADIVVVISGLRSGETANIVDLAQQTTDADAFICSYEGETEPMDSVVLNGRSKEVPIGVVKGGLGTYGELRVSPEGKITFAFK
jgi:2',3'-cyclic-nucleotide 2'-phosphodiesterase (5'-nucleotidase family)